MDSLRVLRKQPELTLFPLISGIAGLCFIGLLFGGSYVLDLFEAPMAYVVLFVLYLGTSFIAAFFNAGLVYSARESFEGREPSVKAGLRAAWSHKTPLFAWAVISATVGMILRAIESQDNVLASIVALVVSVAWSIITYFIIPVIVFEDVGVYEMFKRSGETFKNTWGETAGAHFGVGLITVGFMLVGLLVAAAVFFLLGGSAGFVAAIAIGAVVMLAMFLLSSALGAIAKTALYVYATEGQAPAEFQNVDFDRVGR
jgi:MFS family permease